jgi:GH15 family glucan-1,4-alpha-glucosidase
LSDRTARPAVRLEDLGIIGNCQISALVSRAGQIVWCCLPRFDSEPVFASLLDADCGGHFTVAPASGEAGAQRYLPNTNVLETTFRGPDGAFRVLDFAPRFGQYDRSFRPTQLFRIVEPIAGTPRVRVECAPRLGWSRGVSVEVAGSNHVRYEGFAGQLRLTTDVPISYLGGKPFALGERRHLVLTWGAPVEEPLAPLGERFLSETTRYWQRWVKHCNIPPLFQDEVIRSALVLKLHCFEDTGAIVAATTTSLPEAPGSGRTWDYRYCWLRDSYYVLAALRLLGHFEEREQFVRYLLDVCSGTPNLDLQPLYRIDGSADLAERVIDGWPGYGGDGPVRVGNAAALHRQNDIFGEAVLALSPVFLDDRFRAEQTEHTLALVERLAQKAVAVAGTPDAGIWEVRNAWTTQTFSSLMSWAAADRMARIADRHALSRAASYRAAAARLRAEILERGWSPKRGSLVSSYGGEHLDAALLQAAPLRLLAADDPRMHATIDAVVEDLARDGWLLRYRHDDGLGTPSVAFILCTFWLVEALAAVGRVEEGRQVFARARGPVPARARARGLCGERPAHVGELPAGVLARGAHPRRVRRVASLGAVTCAVPSRSAGMASGVARPSRARLSRARCASRGRRSAARRAGRSGRTTPRRARRRGGS